MSDFLRQLVSRSVNQTALVKPRISSVFEPAPGGVFSEETRPPVAAGRVAPRSILPGTPGGALRMPDASDVSISTPVPTENETASHGLTPSSLAKAGIPSVEPAALQTTGQKTAQPNALARRSPRTPSTRAGTSVADQVVARHPGSPPKPVVASTSIEEISTAHNLLKPVPRRSLMPEMIKPISSVFTDIRHPAESPARFQVTIGRVEVRAVSPSPPASSAPARQRAAPLSLEGYLNRRNGDRR